MEKPFEVAGHAIILRPMIGITTFPHDGADPATLLRNADAALAHLRDGGERGVRFFTADLAEVLRARMAIKTGLSQALVRGDFHLVYQPKVDLASGRPCGLEALLRWTHPELGPVSPEQFVPVLEDSGLIVSVGEWVIEQACRDLRRLDEAGNAGLRLAVNLSARQIRPGLAAALWRILGETGIAPSRLELEVTESVLLKDSEGATTHLQELAAGGIHLALDDFGKGYSALAYPRRLPMQTIKIDRSFIADLLADPHDQAIVRAIIAMGHALGRRVTAEGVETAAQLRFLRRLGCDEGQGFLFGPPGRCEEIPELLRHAEMALAELLSGEPHPGQAEG